MRKWLLLFSLLFAQNLCAQNPVIPLTPSPVQYFDTNGAPLAGGKICSYAAGTSTPTPTFTDSSGLVQNTNPAILNSSGFGNIWLEGVSYKIVVRTPGTDSTCNTGTVISSTDNIPGANVGVSSVAFSAITPASNTTPGTFAASGNSWDFASVLSFKGPSAAAFAPTVSGTFGYDTTANKHVFGQNGTTVSFGIASVAPCGANTFVSTPATAVAAAICTAPSLSGATINGATITASTISGNTISGGTIGGTTISTSTLVSPTITGTVAGGATYNGTTIGGSTTVTGTINFTGATVVGFPGAQKYRPTIFFGGALSANITPFTNYNSTSLSNVVDESDATYYQMGVDDQGAGGSGTVHWLQNESPQSTGTSRVVKIRGSITFGSTGPGGGGCAGAVDYSLDDGSTWTSLMGASSSSVGLATFTSAAITAAQVAHVRYRINAGCSGIGFNCCCPPGPLGPIDSMVVTLYDAWVEVTP